MWRGGLVSFFGVWVLRALLQKKRQQDRSRGLTRALCIRTLDGFYMDLESCANEL